jgi:predicted  nucleic acid-binding Zn-ribbon protein
VKADLDKLIELQKTDTLLRKLKQSLETAEKRRAEIEQEFEQHAFSIREVQARRDTLKAEKADLEKQIADNKTYLERADRNLKHAQNQKEYETAMRETDVLQKQIASFETLIVEKITESEAVEKELEERADEINSLDSKRDTVLSEFDAQVETDRAELEQESEHRKRAFETVPQRFASVYDRLAQRSRDGIAVAEVVNGSCSACFMSLRPQVLLEVKQGTQVVTCESCTRILYFATAASEAGAS